MNRILFPMLVLIAFTTSLFAQTSREKADSIVLEHLQNNVTLPYLLYVYDKAPGVEEIFLSTSHEENMKVKYACWAYYLNENPEMSEPTQHRYLFVKENNGNLLEVITSNDLGPIDLTQWESVPLGVPVIGNNDIRIFPNPTTGEFRISNFEFRINTIEIFDVYGRKINGVMERGSEGVKEVVMDISKLQAGIYFVKITVVAGEVIEKIVKINP